MRARATALAVLGCAATASAALAWAQGVVIPDLRNPALYNEPARGAASCRICGEIRSIREVATEPRAPVAPNPARTTAANPNNWAVVGAAVYLPTGTGANESAQIGAVGTQEMVERFGANTYEITVRMDTGENQVVQRRDGTRFRVGDRVSVSAGMMERL
jgi:outer membrane lipoprotein SlyB